MHGKCLFKMYHTLLKPDQSYYILLCNSWERSFLLHISSNMDRLCMSDILLVSLNNKIKDDLRTNADINNHLNCKWKYIIMEIISLSSNTICRHYMYIYYHSRFLIGMNVFTAYLHMSVFLISVKILRNVFLLFFNVKIASCMCKSFCLNMGIWLAYFLFLRKRKWRCVMRNLNPASLPLV